MRVRRPKPYVCVDCDFAEHFRFQETKDIEAAAGTWLRCLAYSRAQEQDGIVKASWLQRTFATTYERVEELVSVGLLRRREDGDYDLHAYAPRNQTRAMLNEGRETARLRMAALRDGPGEQATRLRPNMHRTNGEQARSFGVCSRTEFAAEAREGAASVTAGSLPEALPVVNDSKRGRESQPTSSPLDSSFADSNACGDQEIPCRPDGMEEQRASSDAPIKDHVRANNGRTNAEREANKRRTNAFVPTSTSTSISTSPSSSLSPDLEKVTEIQRGGEEGDDVPSPEVDARRSLPPSERALSGPLWLAAFTEGISSVTQRPCTAGRMYLGTLERIVTHHAPFRDASRASDWLRDQAKAFAGKWGGKHPPKGLTPDGLERWLNDGRCGPPDFGKARIVQLPADEWTEDDFSDLGAEVIR